MKTLMYPIAPDDDFPEMFCAIRQGSGEHWFYVPEGESASWMLLRAVTENAKLRESLEYANNEWEKESMEYLSTQDQNVKLRELLRDMWHEGMCECGSLGKCAACMYEYPTRMRELGVEVDG